MSRPPRYTPAQRTFEGKDPELAQYVEREFEQVARTFENEQESVTLAPLQAMPDKPRPGMIVFATGMWSPDGGGEGFFGFTSGGWVRLG